MRDALCEQLLRELDAGISLQHVEWLTQNTPHRVSGMGQDRKAAEYICKTLEAYGCDKTKILEYETYNSRPGTSELTLLEPEQRRIESLPCCHVEATPAGGAEYEVVYVGPGAESDYTGKDVAGKAVLVEVSYAPATPEKAMIACQKGASAIICMNWGPPEKELICMRGLKGVWGNPTPDTYGNIPKIIGCSITRKDGERLRDMCLMGKTVRVHLHVTAERIWEKLPQPIGIIRGTEEPEKFLLVSAHLEAWEPGATDNATGNATLLEMARILAKHRDKLRRSICFVFWNGHEIAEASGSTWFVDYFWDEISENCIGYINVDSTGMIEAEQYQASASRELWDFAAETVKYAIGEDIQAAEMGKIADQSFFGIGVPTIFGHMSFTEEVLEKYHGATFGWWNHTAEDGLDKVSRENMERDNRVQLIVALLFLNSKILPYNFTVTAQDIQRKLTEMKPVSDGIIDISNLTDLASRLCRNVEKLNSIIEMEKQKEENSGYAQLINRVLMKLSRTLTGAFYSASSRYAQDSYSLSVLQKPVPLLYPLYEMHEMEETSLEYRLQYTQMLRNRNMLADALRTANEFIESLF